MSTLPNQTTNTDEASLIERIRAGERHLFHELVRPYERAVFVTALGILGVPSDAEEAAQETMLKAMLHLDQLQDAQKFRGWLLQIAVNEARLKRRRDRKHLQESLEGDAADDESGDFMPRDFADWRELPTEALDRKEVRAAIRTALASLPEKYREIFILRDIQELGVTETAQSLGLSPAAVKTRLHRARLLLREKLAPVLRRKFTDRIAFWKGNNPW